MQRTQNQRKNINVSKLRGTPLLLGSTGRDFIKAHRSHRAQRFFVGVWF